MILNTLKKFSKRKTVLVSYSELLSHQTFYLVGIKGVAMTALAQCLFDLGKKVAGADVAEDFVTAPALAQLPELHLDFTFDPAEILATSSDLSSQFATAEVIIYSGAHQGWLNPLVQQALADQKLVLSHAQALAVLFNQRPQGWAVCGANGKSTVSAMLAFTLEKSFVQLLPSYAVGVGEIKDLARIGRFQSSGQIMVVEADEYAEDVTQVDPVQGVEIARFSYFQPETIIANNLSFDHPDVYHDLEHTQQIFFNFFSNLKPNGYLIYNADDPNLVPIVSRLRPRRPDLHFFSFSHQQVSTDPSSSVPDLQVLAPSRIINQTSRTACLWRPTNQKFELTLSIPGDYNIDNALAALTVLLAHNLDLNQALLGLAQFTSTKRRYEILGEINQVTFIDDYAHHPDEITAVIQATRAWYPNRRLVVAFQSHTYSRTKALFSEFVESLAAADRIVMTDIFPSAREPVTPTVTSDDLCAALNQLKPSLQAVNLHDLPHLVDFIHRELQPRDIFLTLGAGDIYHYWELLLSTTTSPLNN